MNSHFLKFAQDNLFQPIIFSRCSTYPNSNNLQRRMHLRLYYCHHRHLWKHYYKMIIANFLFIITTNSKLQV